MFLDLFVFKILFTLVILKFLFLIFKYFKKNSEKFSFESPFFDPKLYIPLVSKLFCTIFFKIRQMVINLKGEKYMSLNK